MKKNFKGICLPREKMRRLLFAMKVSFVLVFICMQFQAQALSQNFRVSLKMKQINLVELLSELQKISKVSFVYNPEDLSGMDRMDVDFTDRTVSDILEICLKDKGLSYKMVNNHVIIKKVAAVPDTHKSATVSGKVVDAKGNPLPGVTISLKGTTLGKISDEKGEFLLELPDRKELVIVFSFVGMKTQEVVYKGQKQLKITLLEDHLEMDEIVVTGIFNRSKSSYTGAVTTITAEELKQFGNRNLLTSLRNIDPSFNIIESNIDGSNPNRKYEVQIRGNSSVPNVDELKDETRVSMNTPLVILDGFESSLERMLDMNENEVESITLLKDASATSIYGSRGANGVIVITTKMPAMGKLRLTYRGDLNIEVPDLNSYDLLGAREKLDLEKKVGIWDSYDLRSKNLYNKYLNDINSGVNTDWLAQPLRVGVGHKHNLRIDGGDKTFRYSASLQYNDVQGVMKDSWRKTGNGSLTLSYYYKNLKFTNNLIVGLKKSSDSPYGSFEQYVRMNPYYRIHDDEGELIKEYDRFSRYAIRPVGNPLYNATLNVFDEEEYTALNNNFSIEWKILPDLLLRGKLGAGKNISEGNHFKPAAHTDFSDYAEDEVFRKGSYRYSTGKSISFDASLNLSYNKTFADLHSLYVGLDYNVRENKSTSYSINAEGYANEKQDFFGMGLQYAQGSKPNGSESKNRAIGLTGSINYTYDNRYYVDLAGRLDGSSQFGSEKRFAPFWSAGWGWNVHREAFLKDNPVISFLKFRFSTGITGSQNFSSYQAQSTYKYVIDRRYAKWMGALMMGLGNEDLSWQQKMNYNFGLEAKFFQNRFSFEANYYIERTKDLVSSINIPLANGFPSYIENIGEMENRGFELKASAFLIRNLDKEFVWTVTGSMIHNSNKIKKVSKALLDAQKELEESKSANPSQLYKPGYSTNTIWVVKSYGIDPSTGREIFADLDGNQTLEWDARNLVACGLDEPKYQGNLSTMVRYKGLMFNMSFGYRFGGQLYNSTLIDKVENANYHYNVDSRVYNDRWEKPGDVVGFKGLDVRTKTMKTSRFVEDEKTLRCQNLTLSYLWDSKELKGLAGMENLTLSFSTSDLFYLSTVKRERGTGYPFSRQFSFSVSATF